MEAAAKLSPIAVLQEPRQREMKLIHVQDIIESEKPRDKLFVH